MNELKPFDSERIYWAVDQVERVGGDIDALHLDDNQFYLKSEADKVIAEKDEETRKLKRALWLMTAEWADAMGLASCNIAIKLSSKERFFYRDEANREKDIKKYKHRQVVFYKYADYCRSKAEEYK